MRKVYALIFDGYADWELGNVLPEIHRLCKLEVVTVGFTDKAVVSMGGLRVLPETVLSKVNLEDVRIFILPGGYLWEGSYPADEIGVFLRSLQAAKIPLAAICAATTVVARAGLLHGRKHTSNSLAYLAKMVPDYSENANYVEALAVRDQGLITAGGLGSVEFTLEILNELDLTAPGLKAIWFEAYKHGKFPENIPAGH